MNNRGELPGYYFDTERQKYFKIQANHQASAAVKHTYQSVQRETSQAKRRKKEADAKIKSSRETVKRSRFARSPLLYGTGLARELGQSSRANAEARDDVFVRQMMVNCVRTSCFGMKRDEKIVAYHDIPNADTDRGLGVILRPAQNDSVLAIVHPDEHEPTAFVGVDTFQGTITGTSATRTPGYSTNVFSCSLQETQMGNLHYSVLLDDSVTINSHKALFTSRSVRPGQCANAQITMWTCASNSTSTFGAVGSDEGVLMVDLPTMTPYNFHGSKYSFRALDWLTPQVLAAGQAQKAGKPNLNSGSSLNGPRGAVFLLDTRSRAQSLRFQAHHPITGIRSANSSQQQLIVTTTHTLSVYDLRKGVPKHAHQSAAADKSALFSIPHASETPQLPLAVSEDGGMVAAPDAGNRVQLYSLRSGLQLARLHGACGNRDRVSQLAFRRDRKARPVLESCQGREYLRFTWMGEGERGQDAEGGGAGEGGGGAS